jgi:hypothetical protein
MSTFACETIVDGPRARKGRRLRRWGGGVAHAGAPVTRTSPAAARSNPAQLGGSLTEQKIRLVVEHVLSLHHIHCLGGAHAQAESTGRAQILAMKRRCCVKKARIAPCCAKDEGRAFGAAL